MKNNLEERLIELRAELARGQQHLEAVDRQRQTIRDTLLRISGAIQVLEELLQIENPANSQTIQSPVEVTDILRPVNESVPKEEPMTTP